MTKKKQPTEKPKVKATEPIETNATDDVVLDEQTQEIPTEDINQKYDALNDSHLRLMAEFDNYRKRTMREKADLLKSAGEGVLQNMLPLVDDFERGIKVMDEATDINAVREGIVLIYDKFIKFLQQQGVKPVDALEKEFDTEFHEAITTIPAPSEALKGKVIDCLQTGYMLNDKVIRYSKVVVGE